MEANFNGIKAVSNDIDGDNFLFGMMDARRKHDKAEDAFESFCRKENIGGWHIANGNFVCKEYVRDPKTGLNTSFGAKEIKLIWYSEDNRRKRRPLKNELLACIDDCVPETDKSFIVYLYDIVNREDDAYSSPYYTLELKESKWCRFNATDNCFKFFVPPPKPTLRSIIKKLFSRNK